MTKKRPVTIILAGLLLLLPLSSCWHRAPEARTKGEIEQLPYTSTDSYYPDYWQSDPFELKEPTQ